MKTHQMLEENTQQDYRVQDYTREMKTTMLAQYPQQIQTGLWNKNKRVLALIRMNKEIKRV
jgi:hypothetical protein